MGRRRRWRPAALQRIRATSPSATGLPYAHITRSHGKLTVLGPLFPLSLAAIISLFLSPFNTLLGATPSGSHFIYSPFAPARGSPTIKHYIKYSCGSTRIGLINELHYERLFGHFSLTHANEFSVMCFIEMFPFVSIERMFILSRLSRR